MEWLKWLEENWIWVCPFIVALYGVARAIVAATPTPTDDEALKKVSRFIRVLAGIFGLDMKQGRKLPAIIIVAGIALSPGCTTLTSIGKDPAKQYKLSKISYSEAVTVLITMKKAGKLDKAETIAATRVINLGREVLSKWEDALLNGKDYPNGITLIGPVISQLKDFIKIGESK